MNKFGPFDEVMSGRSWANTGVLKYVFEDLPGPAATPQVVLVERMLNARDRSYSVAEERVLARAVGLEEIKRWADNRDFIGVKGSEG